MSMREFASTFRRNYLSDNSGFTTLEAAAGFAVLGILAAVFVTPLIDGGFEGRDGHLVRFNQDIDPMTTASTSRQRSGPSTRYTVRRSVLQKDTTKPCILFDSGRREGNC